MFYSSTQGCLSLGLRCPALGLVCARLCRLSPCPSWLDGGRGLWTELNLVANKEEFLVSVPQHKLVLTCFPYFPVLKRDVSSLFYELLAYLQAGESYEGLYTFHYCCPGPTTGKGPSCACSHAVSFSKMALGRKKVFKRGNRSEQKAFHLKFINQ